MPKPRALTYEELVEMGARPEGPPPETLEALEARGFAPVAEVDLRRAPYTPGAVTPERAALLGFTQGGTLGFGEELGAGLAAGLQPPRRVLGRAFALSPDDTPEERAIKLEGLNQQLEALRDDPIAYEQLRDRMRAELAQASEQRPREYKAGELVGALPTALLPGGQPVATGTAARNAARILASGAGGGGLAGLGASVAPPTSGEALRDVATGAAMGAGGALLGAGAAKGAPLALRALGRGAEKGAARWGLRTLLSGADQFGRGGTKAIPEAVPLEALRSGAIRPFGTTQGALQRLTSEREAVGATYGEIIDALERAGVQGPDARLLARDLVIRAAEERPRTMVEAVPEAFVEAGEKVVEKARLGQQAGIAKRGRLGLRQAEDIKRSLQEAAKYGKIDEKQINEARKEIASILRRANERAIMEAAEAPGASMEVVEAAQSFVPVKQRLGRLIEAEKAAERGAQRASTRGVGVGPLEVGLSAASGSAAPAAARLGFNVVRGRGPSTVAATLYPISRALQAGARGAGRVPASSRIAGGAGVGGAVGRALAMEPEAPETEEERRRRRLAEALRNVR